MKDRLLTRYRWTLALFILGLVLSGVTAFPLATEISRMVAWLGIDPAHPPTEGLGHWIWAVHSGLDDTYAHYPWIAYGTDWLAFGHIAIALFFVGAWIRPLESEMIIKGGIAACILVVPTALICGGMRGIPFGWRLIDCSFGAGGIVFLLYALAVLKRLQAAAKVHT